MGAKFASLRAFAMSTEGCDASTEGFVLVKEGYDASAEDIDTRFEDSVATT
jgi:hypothetical protein